jgi:hypothetical protein
MIRRENILCYKSLVVLVVTVVVTVIIVPVCFMSVCVC